MEQFKIKVRPDRLSKWRLLYPNAGELRGLEHLGTVLILATDGCEAFFHVNDTYILHGHLANFNGPISRVYVFPEDWDFTRHRRRVNVFARGDGTYAVIPKDTFWDEYWSMHIRMTEHERNLYANTVVIKDGQVYVTEDFAKIDEALGQLATSLHTKPKRGQQSPRTKRLRAILDTL